MGTLKVTRVTDNSSAVEVSTQRISVGTLKDVVNGGDLRIRISFHAKNKRGHIEGFSVCPLAEEHHRRFHAKNKRGHIEGS